MKHRIFAMLTAGLMCAAGITDLPAAAETEAPKYEILGGPYPDWVPQDFDAAAEFYNTHGQCYFEDNVICIVRPFRSYSVGAHENYRGVTGSMTMVNTPACNVPAFYQPADLGDSDLGKEAGFEVGLYTVVPGYDLTVTIREPIGGSFGDVHAFTFENKDGTIVETDLLAWVPDCITEYNEFQKANGTLSLRDNYLCYCADVNNSTGASLMVSQYGEGELKEVLFSKCSEYETIPLDGSSSHAVYVYQPVKAGEVYPKFAVGREWEPDATFSETIGMYEISEDGKAITEKAAPKAKETRVTLYDVDTNELVPSEILEQEESPWYFSTNITIKPSEDPETWMSTGPIYAVTSNPCIVDKDTLASFRNAAVFEIRGAKGERPLIIPHENGSMDLIFYAKLSAEPDGDLNADGACNLADLVLLHKWMTTEPDTEIPNWKAADFNADGKLNVKDLTLLKQKLVGELLHKLVRPDVNSSGLPVTVIQDDLPVYYGPDESYGIITTLPEHASVTEEGYKYIRKNGEIVGTIEDWMFIIFGDNLTGEDCGWIRFRDADGRELIEYPQYYMDKPVIYLYPEQETEVHVALDLRYAQLRTTYPKYNDGWDVIASPDGTLTNLADGTHHRSLFWDAVDSGMRYDFSRGFCVAGEDTEQFLKEKLSYLGLNENEMNEFIVYWLPRMEHNAYNLITFQGDAYTGSNKLCITPEPDSMLRVFMAYQPLDAAVEIAPQTLETFERTGFTVVEWGGSEIG